MPSPFSPAAIHYPVFGYCLHLLWANSAAVLGNLYDIISAAETSHPNAVFITANDFIERNLWIVLPKYYQLIDIPTHEKNWLDHVYCHIHGAYLCHAPLQTLRPYLCSCTQPTDKNWNRQTLSQNKLNTKYWTSETENTAELFCADRLRCV